MLKRYKHDENRAYVPYSIRHMDVELLEKLKCSAAMRHETTEYALLRLLRAGLDAEAGIRRLINDGLASVVSSPATTAPSPGAIGGNLPQGACPYCGDPTLPADAFFDHVENCRVSRGGKKI